ncbi:MAG: hypothetical protein ACRDMV_01810 [Streptosporangiales bacterium]
MNSDHGDNRDGNRGDNEVWENLVLFVVLGGLAVFGYRKVKPVIEGWLRQHGIQLDEVVHSLGSVSISLDRVIDIAALVLGLFLLITVLVAWHRFRSRRRKHRRVW